MALSLRHWSAAALLGCAGLAVALLPPEVEPPADLARRIANRDLAPSTQIARALRADYEALLYLSRRDDALRLARGSAHTPVVVIDPRLREARRAAVAPARLAALAGSLDSLARALAPLDTGIRVVVFATLDTAFTAPGVGGGLGFFHPTYLLPGATDGRTCLVLLPFGSRSRGTIPDLLGPCAFYAAFGQPGRGVSDWLRRTRYYSALGSDWLAAREPERFDLNEMLRYMSLADVWNAVGYVGLTFDGAACAAGRLARCRQPLEATPPWARPRPQIGAAVDIVTPYWWSGDEQEWFLADLVRAMGRDRFTEFWRSPLPRDSAFSAAFGTSLEAWTHRWITARRPGVHVGSAIRLSSALLGVAFALLLLTGGAYYTTRRQVG